MGHRVSTLSRDEGDGKEGTEASFSSRRRRRADASAKHVAATACVVAVMIAVASSGQGVACAGAAQSAASSSAHLHRRPLTPQSSGASCCFVSAAGTASSSSVRPRRRRLEGYASPAEAGPYCPRRPSSLSFQRGVPAEDTTELSQADATTRGGWGKRRRRAKALLRLRRRSTNEDTSPSVSASASAVVDVRLVKDQGWRSRRRRRRQLEEAEYERRKREWAAKYTDVTTLRSTFGTNRNKFWGDYDPETSRRLYHTLLPRALMGLYDMGLMRPHELAPLAYEARVAAKKYARERCVVPGRVMAMAFDGFRSWKKTGKFNVEGLSWEQIWSKYEEQVIAEMQAQTEEDLDADKDLTHRICLRILERSCITNELFDSLFLKEGGGDNGSEGLSVSERELKKQRDIETIANKLEHDVHELLLHSKENPNAMRRLKRRMRNERKRLESSRDLKIIPTPIAVSEIKKGLHNQEPARLPLSAHEVFALRVLARSKKKIEAIIEQIAKEDGSLSPNVGSPDVVVSKKTGGDSTPLFSKPRIKPWLQRGNAVPSRSS